MKRGVKLASHRERPYLYMGRLYKVVGRIDAAEADEKRAEIEERITARVNGEKNGK